MVDTVHIRQTGYRRCSKRPCVAMVGCVEAAIMHVVSEMHVHVDNAEHKHQHQNHNANDIHQAVMR